MTGGRSKTIPEDRGLAVRMATSTAPLAPAHIDDAAEPRKIVSGDDGGCRSARDRGHRRVHARDLLGLVGAILPDVDSPQVVRGILSGANAVQQVSPYLPLV